MQDEIGDPGVGQGVEAGGAGVGGVLLAVSVLLGFGGDAEGDGGEVLSGLDERGAVFEAAVGVDAVDAE